MGFSISKENIAKGLNTLNTFNSTEGNGKQEYCLQMKK